MSEEDLAVVALLKGLPALFKGAHVILIGRLRCENEDHQELRDLCDRLMALWLMSMSDEERSLMNLTVKQVVAEDDQRATSSANTPEKR